MSNQEFYEIARERVDKRIRRWTFWGIDLLVLIATLAVMILTSNTGYSNLTLAAFLGWCGVFTLHCIVAGFAENRDSEIEGEIAKLRRFADVGTTYEKPKRLELSEDGELVEPDAWQNEEKQRSRMN